MKEINNSPSRYGVAIRVLHGAAHAGEYSLYGAAALGVTQFSPDALMEKYAPGLYRAHLVVTHPVAERLEGVGLSHLQAHIGADLTLEALLIGGAVLVSRIKRRANVSPALST